MRARRVAGILLVVGVIGGALAGFRGVEERGASDPAKRERASLERARKEFWKADAELREGKHHSVALAATGRVLEATEEENAAVSEMIELQRMAEGTGLELAPEQWQALAGVTSRTQAVRNAYEAEIAATTKVAAGRWRMDVPGYAEAGARLRTDFLLELERGLGLRVAAEVIEKLGPALEGYFAGFGVSLQTLDIAADPQGGGAEWEVTRTVAYSKDAMSGEHVAVRRETYFAGREDPVVVRVRG